MKPGLLLVNTSFFWRILGREKSGAVFRALHTQATQPRQKGTALCLRETMQAKRIFFGQFLTPQENKPKTSTQEGMKHWTPRLRNLVKRACLSFVVNP